MKQTSFGIIVTFLLLYFIISGFSSIADKNKESVQEMEIKGIVLDQNAQSPVVILSNKDQSAFLPIWIGLCEARSIELSLSEIVAPRPLTYDFIAALLRTMNAKVERIVIVDMRDEVFYAQVEVSVDGKVSKIDARPSDALALASRMNSPIFVKKEVLEKSALLDPDREKRGL